jgi:long-chain acyl-CoA synthetase
MEAKIWLRNYDDGTPHTLKPYPEKSLLDVVRDTARQRPDHPALLFKGARLSVSELDRLSDAFANALVALGVEKGDRVALLLPNCPQFVIAQLGAWKAGAILVPLNPLYTGHELSQMLNDCGAEMALVLTPFYEAVKDVQPQTSLRCIIATNIKEYLPIHLRFLFSAFKEKLDPALFMYTGGTTGTPKAAVGTHQTMVITAMQIKAWFGEFFVDWEDIVVGIMPLFHAYGNVAVLSTCLLGRHPLALIPNPRDLDDLVDTIRRVQPAMLSGVPTLFIALLHHPKIMTGEVDISSLKLCFSAAAPLMAETKNRFEALTGARIVEGYALTETMVAAVVSPVYGAYKPGSVGMPLPDVEVKIVEADEGQQVLPALQVGEVVMRAPQLMQEYWGRPDETADMLRDGWLYTGDLGYMDEDGYLFIVDRKKDLIKPSGYQVWPREVEEVIATHPAVAEVGVAGVPDKLRGEIVKAWVVLREGQQVTSADIRAYCRERLATYKVPKKVVFMDELPKTMVGKVLRRELVKDGGG